MKIPNKGYEVEYFGDGEFSFFPRKNYVDEASLVRVKLPPYLTKEIEAEIEKQYRLGYEKCQSEMRKSLGISK